MTEWIVVILWTTFLVTLFLVFGEKKCPKCGKKMEYNSYDRLQCPNCGYFNSKKK